MIVTYYPKINNPTDVAWITVDKVFGAIRTGANFKESISKIRKANKKGDSPATRSEVNDLKKSELPGIGFAGKFSHRNNDALMEPSGLMCLDFDKTLEVPEELKKYAFAIFISPGGNGVKVLIKIPLVKNDAQYKLYFLAIEKRFPTVDKSGKDISRLTYLSHDPEIIINEDCPVWTEKVELPAPVKLAPAPALSNKVHSVQSNFAKMTIALQMIQQAPVGNRHETILKAGKLMGGYIGGGEVIESDVLTIFENQVRAVMDKPSDFDAQWKTFKDGIKYGKELPLKDRERERKSTKAEFKAEEVYGDMYYRAEEIKDSLDDLYLNGHTRGKNTGWKRFDQYVSFLAGYYSIFYGDPYTGKTAFTLNLVVNLARLHEDKTVIFSPETGSARDIYAKLIQIHAGGDITNTYKNQISREQYETSRAWVNQYFVVIDNEDSGVELSLTDFFTYIKILESKLGMKFNNVIADPMIEFKFGGDVRDDIFWNTNLRVARVEAKRNQWHLFLITHTIGQKRIGQDEQGNAIFPIPTPRDIAGGQTMHRKGFQILCFYRHILDRDLGEMTILKPVGNLEVYWNSLFIFVQKSKPEGIGKLGRIEFLYQPKQHVYTDTQGDAGGSHPIIEVKEETPFRLPYKESNDEDVPDFG